MDGSIAFPPCPGGNRVVDTQQAGRGERLKQWADRPPHSYLWTDYFVDMRGNRGLVGLWPNSKGVVSRAAWRQRRKARCIV